MIEGVIKNVLKGLKPIGKAFPFKSNQQLLVELSTENSDLRIAHKKIYAPLSLKTVSQHEVSKNRNSQGARGVAGSTF